MPKVIGQCFEFGLEAKLKSLSKAIGSNFEVRLRSFQHEYECSFDSNVGPQNFEFKKKNDYKRETVINEAWWKKIIEFDFATTPNAIGYSLTTRSKALGSG
jgi:hypothetical protein